MASSQEGVVTSRSALDGWRKRVGVEPTIRPAKGRIAGFEGREDHRTPCASDSTKRMLTRALVGNAAGKRRRNVMQMSCTIAAMRVIPVVLLLMLFVWTCTDSIACPD